MPYATLIPRQRLAPLLETFTRRFLLGGSPRAADLEVLALDLGVQLAVQGARLLGVTYDPDTEDLEIALDSGDHRVFSPREVWVIEEEDGFLSLIAVVCEDGSRQLLTVKKVGLRRVR